MSRWTDFRNRTYIFLHGLARSKETFRFHGIDVFVPNSVGVTARYKVLRGRYELQEIMAIKKYLGSEFDVVELGGSIGVISAFISSILNRGIFMPHPVSVKHIVVEANPSILEVLRRNLIGAGGVTHILNSAISYDPDGEVVDFWYTEADNLLGSVQNPDPRAVFYSAPAMTLSDLLKVEGVSTYSLVCDIEGGELDIFLKDTEALRSCQLAIVELHPSAFHRSGASVESILEGARRAGLSKVDQFGDVYVFKRL
jgi:FkbM family methyltransferase